MVSIAESAALGILAEDGLVAFPTETVWGLAARAQSRAAIDRLRAFKGREAGKALSILVDSPERAADLASEWSDSARQLAETFWPGPLTLVVKCGERFAPGVVAADGSIGLRCSTHPVAALLAERALEGGLGPVTATSLNRGGEPPARNRTEAGDVCGDEIPMIAGEAGGGAASTVVDATSARVRVLRDGAIPRAALESR